MDAPGNETHDGQMLDHPQFLFGGEQIACSGARTLVRTRRAELPSAHLRMEHRSLRSPLVPVLHSAGDASDLFLLPA